MFATHRPCRFPNPFMIWSVVFVSAVVLGLTFQLLILPLVPSLHAGNGLSQQDAIHYHNLAVQLAERIHVIGWSEWKVFPGNGGTGNVALLAALYALLGPSPAWFIPFAAAAHATSATVVYLLGPLLWPGREGRVGGLLVAGLFIMFPSAVLSYGQNYKDAFSIAGILIVLYGFLCVVGSREVSLRSIRWVAVISIGIALVWCVRPYLLLVLTGGLGIAWCVMAIAAVARGGLGKEWRPVVLGLVCFLCVLSSSIWLPKDRNLKDFTAQDPALSNVTHEVSWRWRPAEILPVSIDNVLERISFLRVGFAYHAQKAGAGSQIDAERLPDSAVSMAMYLPRAATIGLLAPFPSTWTDKVSLIRIVGAMETMVWYLLIPGVLVLLAQRPSSAVIAGMVVCGVMITFYAYIQPNGGTLFRVRSGPLSFFLLCGAIGWVRAVLCLLSQTGVQRFNLSSQVTQASGVRRVSTMADVSAYGMGVVAISLVGYFGFFVRDLLLVKTYGMSGQLDGFFSASMIPMSLATIFLLPVADAMMAPLIRVGSGEDTTDDIGKYARSILAHACLIGGVSAGVLIVTADWIVPLFLSAGAQQQTNEVVAMVRWFSLILLLSAWTVVGNAVLNALGRPIAAAMAQVSVSVVAVGCILMFSGSLGLRSAVLGLVVGAIVNVAFVAYANYGMRVLLVPRFLVSWADLSLFSRSYASLALAALLVSVTIPIGYVFAARLEPGAVSAWAVGGKLIQLLVGLTSVGAAAVLTPHFARLLVFDRARQLGRDFYFILTAGTWLAIVAALFIVAFAEPVVVAVFHGDEVSEMQARYLAGVLRLGALQLPCIVAFTFIVKFAAASRSSTRVLWAVGLGLVGNVLLNVFLVPEFGVYGIVQATILAAAVSTGYLVVVMRKPCGLTRMQVVLLLASWLNMTGLCASIYFLSGFGAVFSMVVMLVLLWAQWRAWLRSRGPEIGDERMRSEGAQLVA